MTILRRYLPRVTVITTALLFLLLFFSILHAIQLHTINLRINSLEPSKSAVTHQAAGDTVADSSKSRIAWVDGRGEKPSEDYMKHIFEAFVNHGYEIVNDRSGTRPSEWDVLWLHEYPFGESSPFKSVVETATWPQMINHVPGSGYYTSKVHISTANLSRGLPKAFRLPGQLDAFKEYSREHPDELWVLKDNSHRNIKITKCDEVHLVDEVHLFRNIKITKSDEVDFVQSDCFVQKFIGNPLLIDNKKFDIGIYTLVTSVDPLRVYIYGADAIIRFCPKTYHPFETEDIDKYVVGDDYTPIWEIPSFDVYYNHRKLSFRETISQYLRDKGQEPAGIWQQIEGVIAEVFLSQQIKMLNYRELSDMDPKFFELSRFDFIVDEELNVFLMEANMSPNLSSGHFKQNQLLYEQVLLNAFSLLNIANPLTKKAEWDLRRRRRSSFPLASDRDLRVPLPFCSSEECVDCESKEECVLCGECLLLDESVSDMLGEAFREHLQRRSMKRISLSHQNLPALTRFDRLQKIWFDAKCKQDPSWC